MWQIIIFRIALVISIGICLYWCLLHLACYCGDRYIKKRKRPYEKKRGTEKTYITLIYLTVLIVLCILCFLVIRVWIRGRE